MRIRLALRDDASLLSEPCGAALSESPPRLLPGNVDKFCRRTVLKSEAVRHLAGTRGLEYCRACASGFQWGTKAPRSALASPAGVGSRELLSVAPKWQGHGLAEQLMQIVLSEAAAMDRTTTALSG